MESLAADDKKRSPKQMGFQLQLGSGLWVRGSCPHFYAALAVDEELQQDKVKKQMSVSNGKLSVHFEAVEARFLRASYNAFVDVLTLATKTVEELDPSMIMRSNCIKYTVF